MSKFRHIFQYSVHSKDMFGTERGIKNGGKKKMEERNMKAVIENDHTARKARGPGGASHDSWMLS